jgi:hypothetical protein
VHSDDPIYQSHPISYILSDAGIVTLAKAKPATLATAADIALLLEESSEWHDNFAVEVFDVIREYDLEVDEAKRESRWQQKLARTAAWLKAKRIAGWPNGEDSDDEQPESKDEDEQQDIEEELEPAEQLCEVSSDEDDGGPAVDEDIMEAHSTNSDHGPESSESSLETSSNHSLGSSLSSSRCDSPIAPVPPNPIAKPVHARPIKLLKENLPAASRSRMSKQPKSLKE